MNDETTITKALRDARSILKGGSSNLTASDVEDALMAYADLQSEPDESGAAAFVRLLDSHDVNADALVKALDVLRWAERSARSPQVRNAIVKRDEADLDDYVAKCRRDGESTALAFARLARGDQGFADLFRAAVVRTRQPAVARQVLRRSPARGWRAQPPARARSLPGGRTSF